MSSTARDNREPTLLLTVSETADRLHVSKPTVYVLINSGQLRSIKVGRIRRIPCKALEDYIDTALAGGDAA